MLYDLRCNLFWVSGPESKVMQKSSAGVYNPLFGGNSRLPEFVLSIWPRGRFGWGSGIGESPIKQTGLAPIDRREAYFTICTAFRFCVFGDFLWRTNGS